MSINSLYNSFLDPPLAIQLFFGFTLLDNAKVGPLPNIDGSMCKPLAIIMGSSDDYFYNEVTNGSADLLSGNEALQLKQQRYALTQNTPAPVKPLSIYNQFNSIINSACYAIRPCDLLLSNPVISFGFYSAVGIKLVDLDSPKTVLTIYGMAFRSDGKLKPISLEPAIPVTTVIPSGMHFWLDAYLILAIPISIPNKVDKLTLNLIIKGEVGSFGLINGNPDMANYMNLILSGKSFKEIISSLPEKDLIFELCSKIDAMTFTISGLPSILGFEFPDIFDLSGSKNTFMFKLLHSMSIPSQSQANLFLKSTNIPFKQIISLLANAKDLGQIVIDSLHHLEGTVDVYLELKVDQENNLQTIYVNIDAQVSFKCYGIFQQIDNVFNELRKDGVNLQIPFLNDILNLLKQVCSTNVNIRVAIDVNGIIPNQTSISGFGVTIYQSDLPTFCTNDGMCSEDSMCNPGVFGVCDTKKSAGTACIRDGICQSDVCVVVCLDKVGFGKACFLDKVCTTGKCAITCTYNCNNDGQCSAVDDGLFCNAANVCDHQQDNGVPCLRDKGCKSGICYIGFCSVKSPNGVPCTNAEQCQSDKCVGFCADKANNGDICLSDGDCKSNHCHNDCCIGSFCVCRKCK